MSGSVKTLVQFIIIVLLPTVLTNHDHLGAVVGLWITPIVTVGPVYFGLFSNSEFET